MKKVISRFDKKEWYKTISKFNTSANHKFFNFCEGEVYFVRKVDVYDKVDSDEYVIVKGDFDNPAHALAHSMDRNSINHYNGTYSKIPVKKSLCKEILEYVD